MIADVSDINIDENISGDVCIIGAGVAGITIARELIDTNLDVVLLESGGAKPDEISKSLNSGKNIGLPYYDLDSARTRAFGGTSHQWLLDIGQPQQGVRLRSLDKIDFEKKSWIPHSGWPIQKKDLDPYYKKAHEIFQIGSYVNDPTVWSDKDRAAVLSFCNDEIKTTVFQFARKNIFYDDYKKDIETADNILTLLNSTVLNIKATENGALINHVKVGTPGEREFFVHAQYFILAAGGIENPRLLLLSDDVMKNGLGNQYDLVGRYFMEHPHLRSGIYYPSKDDLFQKLKFYKLHQVDGIPLG